MSKHHGSDPDSPPTHVTRRDFMGGMLLGAGGALLSAAAPAQVSPSASAKNLPYALLGPEWTGPGGIGDYARSNGNVYETVNAAHALRDRYWQQGSFGSEPEETFDLVIVGGGISGLMSSYEFLKQRGRQAKVLLLDNHPMFGGEAKQNELEIDGYRLRAPQGSNMFLWPPKTAAEVTTFWHPVWQELGMPMGDKTSDPQWIAKASGTAKPLAFFKDHYTPMMVGRLRSQQMQFIPDPKHAGQWQATRNPWERGYRDFPWPEEARQQLIRLDEFQMDTSRKDFEPWMDTMTYQEFLTKVVGVTRKEVFEYLDPMIAAYGTGLGCDSVSALTAYHFRAPGTLGKQSTATDSKGDPLLEPRSFPGGNSAIARHFVKRLIPDAIAGKDNLHDILYGPVNWRALDRANQPLRMRLSATGLDVRHDGPVKGASHALVTYIDNRTGKLHKVRSKAVIMAGGQWMNKYVASDAPEEVRAAMGQFHHAPMLVLSVGVRHWRFMEQMNVTSARWLGGFGWFTNVRAPMSIDGEHMPLDPNKPAILTFYNPFTCFSPGLTGQGIALAAQCAAARQALWALPYRAIEDGIRKQMSAVFAGHGFDHERDIASLIANRWGHAYLAPQPGFHFGQDGKPAPSEVVRGGFGRVRFAHSELSGAQLWSTACAEGQRAAKQVLELTDA